MRWGATLGVLAVALVYAAGLPLLDLWVREPGSGSATRVSIDLDASVGGTRGPLLEVAPGWQAEDRGAPSEPVDLRAGGWSLVVQARGRSTASCAEHLDRAVSEVPDHSGQDRGSRRPFTTDAGADGLAVWVVGPRADTLVAVVCGDREVVEAVATSVASDAGDRSLEVERMLASIEVA